MSNKAIYELSLKNDLTNDNIKNTMLHLSKLIKEGVVSTGNNIIDTILAFQFSQNEDAKIEHEGPNGSALNVHACIPAQEREAKITLPTDPIDLDCCPKVSPVDFDRNLKELIGMINKSRQHDKK